MFREHTHDPQTGKAIGGERSHGSVLPKILAAVAVINLLRMIASHRRDGQGQGPSWMARKQARIAELHRELHRADAEAAAEPAAAKG
ncbi:MAG TPA: hypothetical protein VIA82_04540 [Candidatus Limnocylindria bacterium]|jgi:hypothetical protein